MKLRLHRFKINELDNPSSRKAYRHYTRRFWHVYKVYPDGMERNFFEGHLETMVRRKLNDDILTTRFHIGNMGSETPWDGHFVLFGIGFFWSHTAFRKLAAWLTRCSGYQYDTRNWILRISDKRLWWEIAEHSDMCRKNPHKRRSWRRGSINISLAEAIWGPLKYTYEDVATHRTLIKMEEGEYAVILKLQRCFLGRTKVPRPKHQVSWVVDVDAPRGIPTHVDHSGGWKGDRTYGFGVNLEAPRLEVWAPRLEDWEPDAEAAVKAWVLKERSRTGFRKPDPVERG